MQQALETLKNRLLQINRRDRSLKLTKIVKKKTCDAAQFSNILTSSKDTIELGSKDDIPHLLPLVKDLEFLEAETGQSECYFGYPFIEGALEDGTIIRCPLFLIPIELSYKKKKFNLTKVGETQINKTLFIALERFEEKGMSLDELTALENLDEVIEYLRKYNIQVIESKEYQNYKKTNNFIPFKELTPQETKKLESKQILTLEPFCVIGQFTQNTSALSYDYHKIIREQISNHLLDVVFGKQLEVDEHKEFEDFPESNANYVYIPDASQEQVLQLAKKSNLVIQGPPGTGKSQVITNAISDAISQNQRVLVVSEKRAALDVVYNRLSGVGLGSQILLIHNATQDRQNVCTKVNSVLSDFTSGSMPQQLETIDVDSKIEALKKTVDAMHTKLPIGYSLYELYVMTDSDATDVLTLSDEDAKRVTKDTLIEMQQIASHMQPLSAFLKKHPIVTRRSFADVNEIELKKVLAKAKDATKTVCDMINDKHFMKDISLLHENQPPSKDLLLELYTSLEYYNKYKDAPIRIANPKYLGIAKKIKKIVRERDLEELDARWKKLNPHLHHLEEQLETLQSFFTTELPTKMWQAIVLYDEPLRIYDDIATALKHFDALRKFDRLLDDQKNIILRCYEEFPQKKWDEILVQSFGLKWIQMYEPQDIQSFNGKTYVQMQSEAIDALKQKTKQVPLKILHTYKTHAQSQSAQNDAKKLVHDVSKKRNKPTLRMIFKNHDVLQFFPCILCSPDTVSSMLPLQIDLFDTVIFDEASQCRIERAIPSILRGKKLIVAGDDQQLPPTTFFQNMDDEEQNGNDEEGDEILDDDSLLSRCRTVFPTRRLLSHYRALYPELIQFSNYAFYDGTLEILPNPKPVPCMSYIHVKGEWKDNKNKEEAQKVIDVLKSLHKSHPKKTFGIITFNQKQREYIQQLIDVETNKSSAFATWLDEQIHRYEHGEYMGLFVKNIENVQGDERDHIIFSLAYGPDEKGKIRYNFGPLNGTYGPNRLNVAISRAKEHIHLCTSITPSQFNYSSDQQGPILLGEYLKFVKAVSDNKPTQPILDAIAQLQNASIPTEEKRGFEVELKGAKEVGTKGYPIPVAQKNTAILSDYTYYHTSKTTKERNIYKPLALQSRGWDVQILWARDKWRKSL